MFEPATSETVMNPEATRGCDVATIVSVIERSDIVISGAAERLPAGYEQVDIAILHWIVAQTPHRPANYCTN